MRKVTIENGMICIPKHDPFPIRYIIFGSKSSLDIDILFWIPLEATKEQPHVYVMMCKELDRLCMPYVRGVSKDKPLNSCLAHWSINNETPCNMIWVQKGTLTETNNSIVYTWDNHPQMYESCFLRKMDRDEKEIQQKIVRSIRVMSCSFAHCMFRETLFDSPLDITLELYQKIISSVKRDELYKLNHLRPIIFQMYEFKTYVIRKCNIPEDVIVKLKKLRRQQKKLSILDVDEFKRIYLESKRLCLPIIERILIEYETVNKNQLTSEFIQNFRRDIAGCELTMHNVCRFVSRSGYTFLQAKLLENIDCTNVIISEDMSASKEVWKKVGFQIGQSFALIRGIELFEKETISHHYPTLIPFLFRYETIPLRTLEDLSYLFKSFVKQIIVRGVIEDNLKDYSK